MSQNSPLLTEPNSMSFESYYNHNLLKFRAVFVENCLIWYDPCAFFVRLISDNEPAEIILCLFLYRISFTYLLGVNLFTLLLFFFSEWQFCATSLTGIQRNYFNQIKYFIKFKNPIFCYFAKMKHLQLCLKKNNNLIWINNVENRGLPM